MQPFISKIWDAWDVDETILDGVACVELVSRARPGIYLLTAKNGEVRYRVGKEKWDYSTEGRLITRDSTDLVEITSQGLYLYVPAGCYCNVTRISLG